ncbi:MAG: hypothetical protein DHS20C10_14070 [marine bacterium B5-7]|nr:MAG: hypothetical protein DHS20C10_14070 [marine bacterium B5-7]
MLRASVTALCVLLSLCLMAAYMHVVALRGEHWIITDFQLFYSSIQHAVQGHSLYAPTDWHQFVGYFKSNHPAYVKTLAYSRNLNTPFVMLFFLPLASLSYAHAFIVFSLFSLLVVVMSIALLTSAYSQRWNGLLFSGWLLGILAFYPTYKAIYMGEPAILLLLWTTLAWRALLRGKLNQLGFWLGIAVSFKWFMGLFAISLLLQKQWRVFIIMSVTFVIANAMALQVFGWQQAVDYFQALHQIYWYAANWNISFLGYWAKLLGVGKGHGFLQWPVATWGLTALCSSIVLTWLVSLHREWGMGDIAWFPVTLCAAILLSPLGWQYDLPLCVIPLFMLAMRLPSFNERVMPTWGLLAVVTGLGFNYWASALVDQQFSMRTVLIFSLPFYALIALMVWSRTIQFPTYPLQSTSLLDRAIKVGLFSIPLGLTVLLVTHVH